jgi:hypothetical protein
LEQVKQSWPASAAVPRSEDFGIGTWFCALRVLSVTNATQTGAWSLWSDERSFTVAPPERRPAAPNLTGIQ